MKAFFGWAKKFNYIQSDPTANLPAVVGKAKATEPVTRAEVQAALKKAPDDTVKLMLRLTADAGLSVSEISLVRPRDLNERGGDLWVHVFGKGSSERDVRLIPELADALRNISGEYIFPGRIDGHVSPAYVVKLISRTLPKGVTSEHLRLSYKSAGSSSGRGWRKGEPFHAPEDLSFVEHPDLTDSDALQQHLRRIARDLDRDPAAAIGACKELLETIFKSVLDARGVVHGKGPKFETFPQLFEMVDKALDLREKSVPGNADASAGIRTAMKGLAQTVEGIGTVRNKIGTGHGHEASPAERRHSRLVFNATVAVAEFISDSWLPSDHPENPLVVTAALV